jgi:hypothetical protein
MPRIRSTASAAAALTLAAGASHAQTFSAWKFGPPFVSAELPATVGPAHLDCFDGPGGFTEMNTQFGTCATFSLPLLGGQSVGVMRVPQLPASTTAYRVFHQTPANGGGLYVNRFTLIYDVLVPTSSFNNAFSLWLSLFNTNATNSNDGDCFVTFDATYGPIGSVGISGFYGPGVLLPDTWHRIVLSFDCGNADVTMRMHKFIDGVSAGAQELNSGLDGRWALYTSADPTPYFFLFGDDNGETNEVYASAFAYIDRTLTDSEAAALGGPRPEGISLPLACYANCDNSTTAPVLNVADFSCFLNAFAAGSSYANCDNSTTAPVLNVADFSCFLNRFAAGCT